jgi:hypothetical protein
MNDPQVPGPYPPNRPPQQGQPYQPYPQAAQPYSQAPPQPSPHQYGQVPWNYYPQQQAVGAQPYGAQGYAQPTEGIALTTRSFPPTPLKPKVLIDGYEIPSARWGRTFLPARPGQHHVHVHIPHWLWPRRMGPADAVVDVYPGRLTELEYKAPVWAYSKGSLGSPPQSYNGVGILIAMMVLPLVAAFLGVIIAVLANR